MCERERKSGALVKQYTINQPMCCSMRKMQLLRLSDLVHGSLLSEHFELTKSCNRTK